MGRPGRCLTGLLTALVASLGGCASGQDAVSDRPSPSAAVTSPTEPPESSTAEPGGLHMTCQGSGSPTVVFEAGLGTSGGVFVPLARRLQRTTRTCYYDRAGIGASPPLADGAPDPSAGSAAAALRRALAVEGVDPPYVVVGWSWGGMVTQAFADRYPDLVGGILLEDSAVPAEFSEPFFGDIDWSEGGRRIDQKATTRQLAAVDFAAIPLVVLTQGEPTGRFRRIWFGYHAHLASRSTDVVHVEAIDSGHEVHADAEDLERALILELIRAVRSGDGLRPCYRRFAALHGDCL